MWAPGGGHWEPGEGEDEDETTEDLPTWRGLTKPPPLTHSMSGDNHLSLSLSLSAAPSFEHGFVGHGDCRRTDNITDNITHLIFLLVLHAGRQGESTDLTHLLTFTNPKQRFRSHSPGLSSELVLDAPLSSRRCINCGLSRGSCQPAVSSAAGTTLAIPVLPHARAI